MKLYITIILTIIFLFLSVNAFAKPGVFAGGGFSLGSRLEQNYSFDSTADNYIANESSNGFNIKVGYSLFNWRVSLAGYSWTTDLSKTNISLNIITIDYLFDSKFFAGIGQGSGRVAFKDGEVHPGSANVLQFGYDFDQINRFRRNVELSVGILATSFSTDKAQLSSTGAVNPSAKVSYSLTAVFADLKYIF